MTTCIFAINRVNRKFIYKWTEHATYLVFEQEQEAGVCFVDHEIVQAGHVDPQSNPGFDPILQQLNICCLASVARDSEHFDQPI